MLAEAHGVSKIVIACGRTDLRRGIDGLARIIGAKYNLNPFEKNVLFLFCGNRSDRIKGLLWEGDGFVLLTKRLGNGHFQWPGRPEEMKNLTPDEFRNLMKGFTIDSSIKEMNPGSYDSFDF